jgi:hypothetical protein
MDRCYVHAERVATGRCKACRQPICEECKIVTDIGIFCSEACEQRIRTFQARVSPDLPPPRRKISPGRFFKGLILIGILLGVFFVIGGLYYHGNPVKGLLDDINHLIAITF